MPDPDCVAFLQWALPHMNLRWRGFRRVRRHLCRDLAHRTAELGLANLAAYRAHLEQHPQEWRVLDAMCTVTISRFYRDAGMWDRLRRDVLPEIARAAKRELRVWSAGCASGEEAYTLAMISRFDHVPLRVIATDVNDEVLSRARRGCYEASSVRELPNEWRDEAFERSGDLWCVRDAIRACVEFRREDIREQMPEGPFDLVMCRNLVFTYFEPALQRVIGQRIAQVTARWGVLVLGAHETMPEGAGWIAPTHSSMFFHQTGILFEGRIASTMRER